MPRTLVRARAAAMATALAVAVGCNGTDTTGPNGVQIGAALVLNTFGQTGITAIPVAAGTGGHIDFGSSFDGVVLTVLADSALSTSSSFGGDQLYVVRLSTNALTKVQLPAGSNPSIPQFVPAGMPGVTNGRILVPLRNTGQLAQVQSPSTVTLLGDAGLCPTDVVFYNGAAWSVDANERCSSDFAVQGGGRLIHVSLTGPDRDTISLGATAIAPLRGIIGDQYAFVLAGGDFATHPAALVKVNLATRQIVGTLQWPAGIYGVMMDIGLDGNLYVTAAPNAPPGQTFAPRAYVVDPNSLSMVGPFASANQDRKLTKQDGTQPRCSAATADYNGRIYCVENGSTTSTMYVFNADGSFVSSTPSGTLASDIVLH